MITFLSDYGVSDDFVGVCHGVIASICPEARLIDVTHGIPRHDVRAGAVVLREALPYMPRGVHLAVVDPGVGSRRRAVALKLGDGRLLVGPDNGLLWPVAQAAGGVAEAVDIGSSRYRLEPVSATFHGRDIFAPVAARLAAGTALLQAGDPCDPEQLVALELPEPRVEDGTVVAHVLYVDRFGNLQLDAGQAEMAAMELRLGEAVVVEVAGSAPSLKPGPRSAAPSDGSRSFECPYVVTFADVGAGELLVYEDSYGRLAIAVRGGSAADRLEVVADDEVKIRRPG